MGVKAGLHQKPMFQEDKADRTQEADVKAATSTIHNLLSGDTLIARVNDEIHICVSAVKQEDAELNNSPGGYRIIIFMMC